MEKSNRLEAKRDGDAALNTLKREGTTEAIDANLTTFKDCDKVVGLDDWNKIEREFMATENGKD